MTDQIHTCGYYCQRPECIKEQRDELRDKLREVLAEKEKAEALPKDGQ